jgi:hypothetical protein
LDNLLDNHGMVIETCRKIAFGISFGVEEEYAHDTRAWRRFVLIVLRNNQSASFPGRFHLT